MTGGIEAKLQKLGLALPAPSPAAGTYLPCQIAGKLVFVSGQVPLNADGLPYRGKLGADLDIEAGKEAATLCALNILAQLREACQGDLSRVSRCIRLGGFVNATPDFTQHSTVINGASDLLASVMGEAGKHARTAVGVSSLPFDVAVEIDAIFELA